MFQHLFGLIYLYWFDPPKDCVIGWSRLGQITPNRPVIGSYLKPKPLYKQRLMAGLGVGAVGQGVVTPPAGYDPKRTFKIPEFDYRYVNSITLR